MKEKWENEYVSTMKLKEMRMKEIYNKLKISKSIKSKLELLKECKETLIANLDNEKMTVTGLEEEMYKKLKETLRTERNLLRVQIERNPEENLLVECRYAWQEDDRGR